jgi:hypothetical protein
MSLNGELLRDHFFPVFLGGYWRGYGLMTISQMVTRVLAVCVFKSRSETFCYMYLIAVLVFGQARNAGNSTAHL